MKIKKFIKDKELIKLFIYQISVRRNFIPFMSVYFLMQPETNLQQVGIFMGIGFLMQILLEVPSGYLSDRWGHKKTLILSKIMALTSIMCYVLGGTIFSEYAFVCFILAASFQSLMSTANSGTFSAFFHDILEEKGDEKKFTKILSQQRGYVSLISIGFILFLPFTTSVLLFFPFIIAGCLDFIGLIAIILVKNVKNKECVLEKKENMSIITIYRDSKRLGFVPVVLFVSLILGLQRGHSPFRVLYVSELGLPLVWIGGMMALSRFFRFVFSHFIHILEEKLTMKQHFFGEIIIFSGLYFLVALSKNMYVVLGAFSLVIGYQWARTILIDKYILTKYMTDKRYKATILSLRGFCDNIVAFIVSFGIGYIMNESYRGGFLVLGAVSFIGLSISYYFIFRKQ